jgi:hypothetical protein
MSSRGIVTPKEIAALLAERFPDILDIPARDREVVALHTLYLPVPRIANMLGMSAKEADTSIRKYGDMVKDVEDSLRMKILRMSIWRFASTAVSVLMEQSVVADMGVDGAIRSLEKIPKIMETLAEVERSLLTTEKQHKEMDFESFGRSLTS